VDAGWAWVSWRMAQAPRFIHLRNALRIIPLLEGALRLKKLPDLRAKSCRYAAMALTDTNQHVRRVGIFGRLCGVPGCRPIIGLSGDLAYGRLQRC